MSNPRYVPKTFLVTPRDFGRRLEPEWVSSDETYDLRRLAQLDASKFQHQVAYGVAELYLQSPHSKTISGLASALGVEYNRLQKVLSGAVVMQLKDLSRLRLAIGPQLDRWVLRAPSAQFVRADGPDPRIQHEEHSSGAIRRDPQRVKQ